MLSNLSPFPTGPLRPKTLTYRSHAHAAEWCASAAADAHHSAAWAWDLYVNVFGRNGPVGNGDKFDNIVNYTNPPMFASRTMWINIGDARCEPETDLMTVGHEVAHGFF